MFSPGINQIKLNTFTNNEKMFIDTLPV